MDNASNLDLGIENAERAAMKAIGSADKNILRQILTYVPGSVIPAIISIITTTVFTRVFSAAEYGAYSLFLIIALTFRSVSTMWLIPSSVRELSAEGSEEGRRSIKLAVQLGIWLILSLDTIMAVAAMFLLEPLMGIGRQDLLVPMIAFVISSSIFDIVSSLFPAEKKAKDYVSFKLLDSVITLALRLLFVLTAIRMDIIAMFWSVFISAIVLLPFMWSRARIPSVARILLAFRSRLNWEHLGRLFKYGLPMTLWYFTGMLLDSGDRYVLQFYLGPRDVGIYDASYRMITGTVSLLLVPTILTLHPYLISISGSGDNRKIGKVIEMIIETMILLGLAAVGLVFIFHQDIALLLMGQEFREGSVIMPVVLAGVLISNMGFFAHKPFEIEKKLNIMLLFGGISAAANLLLNFILIPLMGYMGSAYATMGAYSIYALGTGMAGRRLIPWRIDWRRMFLPLMAILGSVAAIYFLRRLAETVSYALGFAVALILALVLIFFVVKLALRWHSGLFERDRGP